jgi:hypothetical protein
MAFFKRASATTSVGSSSCEDGSVPIEVKASLPHINSAYATREPAIKIKHIDRMLNVLRRECKATKRALANLQDDIYGLKYKEDHLSCKLDKLKMKQGEMDEKASDFEDHIRRMLSDIEGLQAVRHRLAQIECNTQVRESDADTASQDSIGSWRTVQKRNPFSRLIGHLFHKQHGIEALDTSEPTFQAPPPPGVISHEIPIDLDKRIEEAVRDIYPEQKVEHNSQQEHETKSSQAPTRIQRALSKCTFKTSLNVPDAIPSALQDQPSSSATRVPRIAMSRLMSRRIKRKPLPVTSDLNISLNPELLEPIAIDLPHQGSHRPVFVEDQFVPAAVGAQTPVQHNAPLGLMLTQISPFSPQPQCVYDYSSPVSPESPRFPVSFDSMAAQQGSTTTSSITIYSQTEKEALPCYLQNPRAPVFDTCSANVDIMNEDTTPPQICGNPHKRNQCICTPPFPSHTSANNSPRKLWKVNGKCPTCSRMLCRKCTKSRKRAQAYNTSERVQRKLQRQWDDENRWKMVAFTEGSGPAVFESGGLEDQSHCLCHNHEELRDMCVAPFLYDRLREAQRRAGWDVDSVSPSEESCSGTDSEDGSVSWLAGDDKKAMLSEFGG